MRRGYSGGWDGILGVCVCFVMKMEGYPLADEPNEIHEDHDGYFDVVRDEVDGRESRDDRVPALN